ncbi:MAG: PDZ domain-containing protein [Planctomycetes bacterium]|nr:PDZ domain-containing protein [Planctomycetota bacterium]
MRNRIPCALLLLAAFLNARATASGVDLPRWPSISPDGQSILFSWQGDLWLAPTNGGNASRVTNHPSDDTRSEWSPDGATIAFESTRDGYRNIWTMPIKGGDATQITFGESPCTLSAFALDASGVPTIYFDSTRESDFYRVPRSYKVAAGGGRLERVNQAYGAHPAPNGRGQYLIERGGSAWSRRGYRGSDQRDVWLFDASKPMEQAYTRLTAFQGNDGQALWCGPDSYLMVSERDGVANLYRRKLSDAPDAPGEKLTDFADDITSFDVSADGKTAVIASWNKLYRLDLAAPHATPKAIELTAAADVLDPVEVRHVGKDVTEAALSPDGKTMAFVAYGDVFVRSMDEKSPVVRVTSPPSRERDIAWSADGSRLYFVTDASGNEDIVEAIVSRTRSELRKEAKSATEPAKPAPAEVPAKEDAKAGEKPDANKTTEEKSDAPKGEPSDKPAAKADEKDDAAKADEAPKPPADHRLDPARWTEAVAFEIRPVVQSDLPDREPAPSPDGKWIAYRQGNDLMIFNLTTNESVTFRDGWDPELEFQWSPDSKWIAFAQDDRDFNRDIWLAPVDGSKPAINITRHPDNDRSPRFSADGKLLAFLSDRVNNESDVWGVDLDKSIEGYSAAELEAYFKDANDAAKKRKPPEAPGAKKKSKKDAKKAGAAKKDAPEGEGDEKDAAKDKDDDAKSKGEESAGDAKEALAYDLDDAYLRVRRLTRLAGDETGLNMTPGGERVIFSGNDGGPGVFSVKWDGTDQKKVAPAGRVIQVNLAGDKVVLFNASKVSTTGVSGGESKSVDFEADTLIDPAVWSDHRFQEAARVVGEIFYDPAMKGLDWETLSKRYQSLARSARTDGEFEWIMARLLGELNASHLGVSLPSDKPNPSRQPVGRLGVRTRSVPEGFEVMEVLAKSPAAISQTPLRVGDVIVAIGGEPIAANETLEQKLRGRVGLETLVSVRRNKADGTPVNIDCLITPCTNAQESELAYQAATLKNAALVNEWSGGRIGYLHIQSMSQASLDEFERDLCAAAQGRDGLLVDVRNNGGGSTADRVLASLMAPVHAYTVPRGADRSYTHGYPQDRLFIQRWTLPANMLCNEKSFSNAEIVSHAFKNLKRGSLVGEQTYGGVISTGSTSLTDGTTIRTPFRGWYTPEGTDMENHGAMPNVRVPANPIDESNNFDAQLRAAVDDLMKRLPADSDAAAAAPAQPGNASR